MLYKNNIIELQSISIKNDKIINDLTKTLDSLISFKTDFNTYIYNGKINNRYLIRFLGATRGYIEVDDNNIITNIEIFKDEDLNIYSHDVLDHINKYIDMKIIINNEDAKDI